MRKEELIEKAYKVFSNFKKPKQCTKYTDFEDAEFNELLLSATRRSLTNEQVSRVNAFSKKSYKSRTLIAS